MLGKVNELSYFAPQNLTVEARQTNE